MEADQYGREKEYTVTGATDFYSDNSAYVTNSTLVMSSVNYATDDSFYMSDDSILLVQPEQTSPRCTKWLEGEAVSSNTVLDSVSCIDCNETSQTSQFSAPSLISACIQLRYRLQLNHSFMPKSPPKEMTTLMIYILLWTTPIP